MSLRLAPLAMAVALVASCGRSTQIVPGSIATAHRDVELPRDCETIDARVPKNATLEMVLRQNGIPAEIVTPVIGAVRGVFDPRGLRANQAYHLTHTLTGAFREFRYEIDPGRFLRVSAHDAGGTSPSFDAAVVDYPRDVNVEAVSAEITRERPSLTEALNATGQNVQLALAIADIFGGEVDFNSELQRGDRLDVLFERVRQNGELVGYGNVSAAVLTCNGRRLTAIEHIDSSGRASWYDEDGRSLKRQFLRSPLRLDADPRVTSRFSYNRKNPVSGENRAHLGVDYEALYGQPVIAVAAGTIELADWAGEAGRMVLIRHSGGYETAYLHLSAFGPGIHSGARVDQGQLIGKVGATGTATGPHLDYRIKKNGTYVNPLMELSRMPKGESIPAEALTAFARERDRALDDLKGRVSAASATDTHPH